MKIRIYTSVIFAVLSTGSLSAALIVSTLADSGPGSLRDQIAASIPGDTLQFSVNGNIVLSAALVVPHTLWIQGPGPAKLTVSGNSVDRVFITGGNPVVLSGMTIRDGLGMGPDGIDGPFGQNGTSGGPAYGGAILNNFNSDRLVVSNCWLVGNTVRGGRGGRGGNNPIGAAFTPGNGGQGGFAFGGAIYGTGKVSVVNCTFSDNHAIGGEGGGGGHNNNFAFIVSAGAGGAGGGAQGGGAEVSAATIPAFTNCTLSGNSALGGSGGEGGTNAAPSIGGNGGNGSAGTCGAISLLINFDIISCTIVSNSAIAGPAGLGGFGFPPGSSGAAGFGSAGGICGYAMFGCVGRMGNAIVAENFASTVQSNVYINVDDLGFNFVGDNDYFGTCVGNPTTRIGTVAAPLNPQLAPLAQNGSGLPTHAPLSGSLAIDYGYRFNTTTDERRAPRPFGSPAITSGDGSDIGAFEFGSTPMGIGKGGTNGNQLILTWPAWYGDFSLQVTTDLLSPNGWSGVTDAPVVVDDLFIVTNSPVGGRGYFRLIRR